MNANVKELIELSRDDIEPKLAFANSKPWPTDPPSGDRLKTRLEIGMRWEKVLALVDSAAASCPSVAPQVIDLRTALANALHHPEMYRNIFDARTALEAAAYQAPAESPNGIPVEHRSRPMNAADAARYHAGHRVSNATMYLKARYESGVLTSPIGSGQNRQWDVREFPENSQRDVLKTNLI